MRVLKPVGIFDCLEAVRIPHRFVHAAYLGYVDWCPPVIGRIAADGDTGAYDHLLRGIHESPSQALFADELRSHGFEDVSFENMAVGIAALHPGRKPQADADYSGAT